MFLIFMGLYKCPVENIFVAFYTSQKSDKLEQMNEIMDLGTRPYIQILYALVNTNTRGPSKFVRLIRNSY